jgi:hypothetical protein
VKECIFGMQAQHCHMRWWKKKHALGMTDWKIQDLYDADWPGAADHLV